MHVSVLIRSHRSFYRETAERPVCTPLEGEAEDGSYAETRELLFSKYMSPFIIYIQIVDKESEGIDSRTLSM